ncbi:MAG: hypothetical protein AAFP19_23530 [Bacteroidota bacterium]
MKYTVFTLLTFVMLLSCNQGENNPTKPSNDQAIFESIRVDRFAVKDGNPDSTTLSSYILRTFDEAGTETKSVYHSTDNAIMMQFVNNYEDGNKTRINWVNANDELVKYVKNTFNNDNRLIRSESFSPEHEFQSGFIHNWKDDGKVEEKGPIEEGQTFKPNAIYTYNDQEEFELLKEYDKNDSLYAVVRWNYVSNDELGNWTERQMITNDTINQIEKRSIKYKKGK